jgi:hypothetical protein
MVGTIIVGWFSILMAESSRIFLSMALDLLNPILVRAGYLDHMSCEASTTA